MVKYIVQLGIIYKDIDPNPMWRNYYTTVNKSHALELLMQMQYNGYNVRLMEERDD